MKTNLHLRDCKLILGVLLLHFVVYNLSAQPTTIQLNTSDNTSSFQVLDNSSVTLLSLYGDAGFYVGGTFGTGVIPKTGAGMRLMWHPAKAAFRAGSVDGIQWDESYVGSYSFAAGLSTSARGNYTTAFGNSTTASGEGSISMGGGTLASGLYSTAMGGGTTASGSHATAIGGGTTASGTTSVAMGASTIANGSSATAMGEYTIASGNNSTAMGYYTTANGSRSTSAGSFVSTNNKSGAMIIGDLSGSPTNRTYSSANDEMTMRFAGGYRLYTNSGLTAGVTLAGGGNSWSSVSDENKKEKFVKAAGEYFLNGLAQLKLGSWNYIGQDAKDFRHYGPMAQEIFKYFGNDGVGTIGNDTTLASADMDGIMMICLQALEKRSTELNAKQTQLDETVGKLQKANERITLLEQKMLKLQEANDKYAGYETEVRNLSEKMEKLTHLLSTPKTINQSQLTNHLTKEVQQ